MKSSEFIKLPSGDDPIPSSDVQIALSECNSEQDPAEIPEVDFFSTLSTDWPSQMNSAAFNGLAGEIVKMIEDHSEADRQGLLLAFLTVIGNIFGDDSHIMIQAKKNTPKIWSILVGDSSRSRKGTTIAAVLLIIEKAFPEWSECNVESGLSSGEGLTWMVRDPVYESVKDKNNGEIVQEIVDYGVHDKRKLCLEEEFSSLLKNCGREGNTLSDNLRKAFDQGRLSQKTKRHSVSARKSHISIHGHCTEQELRIRLSKVDSANGLANRFLFCSVRRSKDLPDGGRLHHCDFSDIVAKLREVSEFAKNAGEIELTPKAKKLWAQLYPVLGRERHGLLGGLCGRAEVYCLRLALCYALLDCSEEIEPRHILSALAVWDYCERSTLHIFGQTFSSQITDEIASHLSAAGPVGRPLSFFHEMSQRNRRRHIEIKTALQELEAQGLIRSEKRKIEKGRSPTFWVWNYEKNEKNTLKDISSPFNSFFSYNSEQTGNQTHTAASTKDSEPVNNLNTIKGKTNSQKFEQKEDSGDLLS